MKHDPKRVVVGGPKMKAILNKILKDKANVKAVIQEGGDLRTDPRTKYLKFRNPI